MGSGALASWRHGRCYGSPWCKHGFHGSHGLTGLARPSCSIDPLDLFRSIFSSFSSLLPSLIPYHFLLSTVSQQKKKRKQKTVFPCITLQTRHISTPYPYSSWVLCTKINTMQHRAAALSPPLLHLWHHVTVVRAATASESATAQPAPIPVSPVDGCLRQQISLSRPHSQKSL